MIPRAPQRLLHELTVASRTVWVCWYRPCSWMQETGRRSGRQHRFEDCSSSELLPSLHLELQFETCVVCVKAWSDRSGCTYVETDSGSTRLPDGRVQPATEFPVLSIEATLHKNISMFRLLCCQQRVLVCLSKQTSQNCVIMHEVFNLNA